MQYIPILKLVAIGPPTVAGRVLWTGSTLPSVRSSVRPSFLQFSWNWLISFFWNVVWCYGPIKRCARQGSIFWKKTGKNDPKWVLGLFRKIYELVLFGNSVEWKYLWPFRLVQKPHIWEKPDSEVMAKMLSTNQISVFFDRQYLVNGLTSDSTFLHVDRHEWMRLGLLIGFLEKLFLRQTGNFGPKNGASL